MFAKNTMKYPILVMGLIMFGIFLSQETTHKWWAKQKTRFIPSTCKAVMERVEKKAPSNWELECLAVNFLKVDIEFDKTIKDPKKTRMVMYRQLANLYSQFAQFANVPLPYVEDNKTKVYNEIETLERLQIIQINLKGPKLLITSQSDGQAVAKFITLKRTQEIAEHLKLTVKVGEKRF